MRDRAESLKKQGGIKVKKKPTTLGEKNTIL